MTQAERDYTIKQIECAKKAIANEDPGHAAFCLRDLSISKELGIDDMFATLASHNGFPHVNDLKPLIERIEKAIAERDRAEKAAEEYAKTKTNPAKFPELPEWWVQACAKDNYLAGYEQALKDAEKLKE